MSQAQFTPQAAHLLKRTLNRTEELNFVRNRHPHMNSPYAVQPQQVNALGQMRQDNSLAQDARQFYGETPTPQSVPHQRAISQSPVPSPMRTQENYRPNPTKRNISVDYRDYSPMSQVNNSQNYNTTEPPARLAQMNPNRGYEDRPIQMPPPPVQNYPSALQGQAPPVYTEQLPLQGQPAQPQHSQQASAGAIRRSLGNPSPVPLTTKINESPAPPPGTFNDSPYYGKKVAKTQIFNPLTFETFSTHMKNAQNSTPAMMPQITRPNDAPQNLFQGNVPREPPQNLFEQGVRSSLPYFKVGEGPAQPAIRFSNEKPMWKGTGYKDTQGLLG